MTTRTLMARMPIVALVLVVGFSANRQQGEEGEPWLDFTSATIEALTATINGTVEGAETVEWDWGDGTPNETGWFPAFHAYDQPGTYRVTVTASGGRRATVKKVVVILPIDPTLTRKAGQYVEFSLFPARFFQESLLSEQQILAVLDAQYLSLKDLLNDRVPYAITKITYNPPVHGQTSQDGLVLGDSAFPGLNGGHPAWGIMAHELGHNFFAGTSSFYYTLAESSPFLQESAAELSNFYSYHYILAHAERLGIDAMALESLRYVYTEARRFQQGRYEAYVAQGRRFDTAEVLTSQALTYSMVLLGEAHGWEKYRRLTRAFEEGMAPHVRFHQDGVSPVEQSTYIIAALSVAFGQDLRQQFQDLGFPVDETLYQDVHPAITAYLDSR